jgi:glyoxylase-like metal-dependent hydrolase (beta-lactamase superfamily II)
MRRVVGSFRRFTWLRVANVYLLDGGVGDRWLVDTGHVLERPMLLAELRRARLSPSDLTGVLLTHRHSDHAGNAAFFQRAGVRVHAHARDAEVLAGRSPRHWMRFDRERLVASLLGQVENYWPAEALEVDVALEDGATVAGLEVHAVPGHTEGSVFYRHEATETLLSGDTLLAAHPPLTLREGLAPPYPTFSVDLPEALASLRAFHDRGFAYRNLLSGHGPPIVGRARDEVLALLGGWA